MNHLPFAWCVTHETMVELGIAVSDGRDLPPGPCEQCDDAELDEDFLDETCTCKYLPVLFDEAAGQTGAGTVINT